MALNYDYNSLKVETTGRTVYVPDNDLARLMYYLDCVLAVIQYDENSRLTDYENYFRLTKEEENAVYALAALFQPKIFIDAGVFLPKPNLVPYGKSNQFYKITDDRIGIHVNQEIVIGGRVVRVLEVMAFTQEWLNRNYIEPLENITYRLESQQNRYISPPPANIYVKISAYNVTFNSNGWTSIDTQVVGEWAKAKKPTDPTRDGYTFDKWYSDEALTKEWNFDSDTVNENITLYAK